MLNKLIFLSHFLASCRIFPCCGATKQPHGHHFSSYNSPYCCSVRTGRIGSLNSAVAAIITHTTSSLTFASLVSALIWVDALKFILCVCVSLVISCRSLSAEHRSIPMADVQRTISYIRRNIFRGQMYSTFEVHFLHFSFSLCAPLYTKFLGQETFLSRLKYVEETLQVKFYVRVPFQYNRFNIEIRTSFPS
jgi:hypothetical protein